MAVALVFKLEQCKSMLTDTRPAALHYGRPVHIFNMEVNMHWGICLCFIAANKMCPNIKYPNHLATASLPVKQAWWTGVAVLGDTSHRKNPSLARYIAKHLHQSLHSNVLFDNDVLHLKGDVKRGWTKPECSSSPCRFPALSACPWPALTHTEQSSPKSGYQVQKCWTCSKWSRSITLLGGGRTGLVSGFSSHKTAQTEREWKGGWTEALSSSSPDSVPGCCAKDGEILPVHIQGYWTLIILLVTSPFASWVPRFPTLKTFPIRLKNLALTACTNPLVWLTCTGSCVNLSFNSATRCSHARSALQWPDPGQCCTRRMNIPLTHAMHKAGAGNRDTKSSLRQHRAAARSWQHLILYHVIKTSLKLSAGYSGPRGKAVPTEAL